MNGTPLSNSDTPKSWTDETIELINALTPNIKQKSFDPDWFLLRQRFERYERDNNQLRDDLKKCVEALKENRITVSRSGAGHVCVGCGEPFQHPHKDFCLINKALSTPSAQAILKQNQ